MMPSEESSPVQIPPAGPRRGAPSWFGNLGQADFEIEFFERILARRPDQVNVLRALGELLARKGLWERSLKVEERLIELRPQDGVAHYNLACSLAMQGAASQAIGALARAIDLGYRDFGHLEVDPDLDSLRHLPAYRALLRRHREARITKLE
jgi:tetratricopeptide (TPR) repeat protein